MKERLLLSAGFTAVFVGQLWLAARAASHHHPGALIWSAGWALFCLANLVAMNSRP